MKHHTNFVYKCLGGRDYLIKHYGFEELICSSSVSEMGVVHVRIVFTLLGSIPGEVCYWSYPTFIIYHGGKMVSMSDTVGPKSLMAILSDFFKV